MFTVLIRRGHTAVRLWTQNPKEAFSLPFTGLCLAQNDFTRPEGQDLARVAPNCVRP